MAKKTAPLYEDIFRGKFLFDGCTNFDELIQCCTQQAKRFRQMKTDKIEIEVGSNDYFFLRTKDPVLAKKHRLTLLPCDE